MAHRANPSRDPAYAQTTPSSAQLGIAAPWILAATILGSSLAFIDSTVVNVALPAIQRDLHATTADLQWVIEAYLLFLSALILVGGSLGDQLGRRRVFSAGIVLFMAASVVCGLAPTLPILIAARAVQGVGGALLVPGSLAIITATFDASRRGRAIGTWSAFTTITSALGPVLGGWLVQTASWRWVFFINVPLALLTLAITFRYVPETRNPAATRQDWPGAALATLGLGALVFGLIESSVLGLGAPLVLASIAVGLLALVSFVAVEARSRAPMVPLTLFRSRTFSGTNLLTLLLYGALGGALYFLPFNLQQVQGYTAAEAGAAFLPFTLIVFALSPWAGGLVARYGARAPLIVGPIVAAAGFALFAVPGVGGSYWTTYFPAVVVLSLGMAIVIAPLTTAVMGAVSAKRSGVASGVNNAVARTAGLLAIAILNLVVVSVFASLFLRNLQTAHLPADAYHALAAQSARLAGARVPPGLDAAAHAAAQRAIDTAYVGGFRVAMLIGAGMALAASLMAALLVEGKGVAAVAREMARNLRARPRQNPRRAVGANPR
jgi:EmrB/QacA subfamily drug resistance transporter